MLLSKKNLGYIHISSIFYPLFSDEGELGDAAGGNFTPYTLTIQTGGVGSDKKQFARFLVPNVCPPFLAKLMEIFMFS